MFKIVYHLKTVDKGTVTKNEEFKVLEEAELKYAELYDKTNIIFIKLFDTVTGEVLRQIDK